MRVVEQKRRGFSRSLFLIMILSMIISIQIYATTLNQSHAAYSGVLFGTEDDVKIDGGNDIWQVEKSRYSYIANNQIKPEVDLLGLNVTRDANELVWCYDYETFVLGSINISGNYIVDYNFSYIFNVSLSELINITYSVNTNQTFASSSLNFINWTTGLFQNDSAVQNITSKLLPGSFYSTPQILLNLNVSHSTAFIWWVNITYEFLYRSNQVITLGFSSLTPGNASLNENLKAWIFLDTDGDDQQEYVIYWIYGIGVNIYEISNDTFTLGGYWNGQWAKYWNGMRWKDILAGPRGGFSALTTNSLNITLPDYIVNLTPTVTYGVWCQKIEASYDWWDALPNDSNWQLSQGIPSFTPAIIGFSLLIIGILYWIKSKKIQKLDKLI